MAKPGRNDPCHCGSGKKYKKCSQPKEEAAEHEELAKDQLRREEARRVEQRRAREEFFASLERDSEEDPELIKASNAALDLVEQGRFEEAETAARDLIERYPDTHDGWDRLGMMHEAKGEKRRFSTTQRSPKVGHRQFLSTPPSAGTVRTRDAVSCAKLTLSTLFF
jgi:tetratricopeptide (TPR) repeat protein